MDLQHNLSPIDLDFSAEGKPFLTKDQVVSLMKENYNCAVKKVKLLDSYDNQNFLLEVVPLCKENEIQETDELTKSYVLKITNSCLSKADQGLKDSTRIMEFLSSKGFSCTKPVPNKNGDYCQLLTFHNMKRSENVTVTNRKPKDTFMVRLVTFLPGTILIDLPLVPDNVFEEMGETLGQMHVALQELDIDKNVLQEMAENFPWSLDCLSKFRELVYVVDDLERRALVEDVMKECEKIMSSRKHKLPHGFIHGDFNDGNIIVDHLERSDDCHMIGFIDFDDFSYSCTVYDIGISLMYALQCKTASRDSAAKHFLWGYNKYRKMTRLEKDCLFYCTAGRFVQSLLAGLFNYSQTKNEYVLISQQRGWDALKEMWTRGKDQSYQEWHFAL